MCSHTEPLLGPAQSIIPHTNKHWLQEAPQNKHFSWIWQPASPLRRWLRPVFRGHTVWHSVEAPTIMTEVFVVYLSTSLSISGWYFEIGLYRFLSYPIPCGGGVEYLHRDPASRRRRRKGKSQIWDSKIWSRVPRDSDPRKTALARVSSIYKRQTRPLVREGSPQKTRPYLPNSNKYLVVIPRWGSTPRLTDWLTDWPSVAMWLWLSYPLSFDAVYPELLSAPSNKQWTCRVWGSHTGGYEEYCLLGSNAV
jgi:hypothetical protein